MDAVGEVRRDSGGDGIEVVELHGEHDLGTLPKVREAFEAAGGEKALIIDLSTASFVDSSILGAVLDARRLAGEAGRGFAVACGGAAEPVRRVLEVTGLAEELPVHPNREAALSALAGAPT
ncbi:MAG: STAS domain-containing protein [Actinomycetota bacterium]|nr:STAS domain-containing protein [Actinomycetota bacterium]